VFFQATTPVAALGVPLENRQFMELGFRAGQSECLALGAITREKFLEGFRMILLIVTSCGTVAFFLVLLLLFRFRPLPAC